MKRIIVSAVLTSALLSACGSSEPAASNGSKPNAENIVPSNVPTVQSSTVVAPISPASQQTPEPVPVDLQEPLLGLKRTVFTMRELESGKNWEDTSVSANIINDCNAKEMVFVTSLLKSYKTNVGENQLREQMQSSVVALGGSDPSTLPYQFADKYFGRVLNKMLAVPVSDLSGKKEDGLKNEFLSDCALMKTSRVMYTYMNNVDLLQYLANNPSVVQELGLTINKEAVDQMLSARLNEEKLKMKSDIMASGTTQQ